jgi:hypothetical protein
LILSKEIVKFGELIMPVALSVLLDLADYDRELLMEAQNEFAALSSEGRTIELLEDRAKLAFGFKIDDVIYDRVEFGKHNTGRDEVEADRLRLSGLSRECFLVGKQISALKTSDGSGVIDGPIELERFESLVDGGDIVILRGAAFLWRQTFRLSGEKVSRNGRSADGTDSRHKDGLERGKDSGAPAGTA